MLFSRFKTPLIAVLLGVLPFFVFLGSSQTVTVNGATVRDEQINLVGMVVAVAGLWLAFAVLRPSAPRDSARKILAGIAGALCLLQLAASFDLIRPLDWLTPDSDLPPLAYNGLSDGNRNIVDSIVERGDRDEIMRDLMNRAVFTLDDAHQHMDYADTCHEGRYRIDYDALLALFAVLPEAQQDEVKQRAAELRRPAPTAEDCTARRTDHAMGKLVDDVNQQKDMLTILRDGYVALMEQQ